MDPRILIPDIRHFKQVFIETASFKGLHEHLLMGFGAAGGDHNAVEFVFDYFFLNFVLGVLAAGKQILISISYMGKCTCIFFDCRNINNPSDVDTAVADKDTDSGFLALYVDLVGNFDGLDIRPPCFRQIRTRNAGSSAGFCHRAGNVLGAL